MARNAQNPITWPGREVPQEFREVAQALVRDQGWTYVYSGFGRHPVMRDPQKRGQSTVPTSPSDHRAFRNWLGQLRALGADLDLAKSASTDDRRAAAAKKVAAHRAELERLAEAMADQPHVPFYVVQEAVSSVALDRDETHVVGDTYCTPARTATPLRAAPSPEARREAHSLLMQGYHVDRAAARTGVSVLDLQHLVGPDGYHL